MEAKAGRLDSELESNSNACYFCGVLAPVLLAIASSSEGPLLFSCGIYNDRRLPRANTDELFLRCKTLQSGYFPPGLVVPGGKYPPESLARPSTLWLGQWNSTEKQFVVELLPLSGTAA
ncbi:unnamed protein product [Pleuronectes platessa]|uniref:Uncharacterized protein n=1 Tax=Pleuronectes platessa TaxID=8262 RepID=A0A9N7VQJ0_PLEPL|nr:unnamed protein product [Pleuronectes platessa]